MKTVHDRRGWILPILLLSGAGLLVAAGEALALQGDEGAGFMSAKGRVTFRVYCASCHGREAKGDGNLAQYLTVKPADLRLISARRGGEFPREEVAEIIDGRRRVRGHGTHDMPVWGDVFESPLSETEPGPGEPPEDRVKRKIKELVLYLESIQIDEPEEPDEDEEDE